MTPAEVKALSVTEYLAFVRYMDDDIREQRKAAKKRR